MPSTKVSIIYYSQTGTVETMAARLAETAKGLGAEVRLLAVGREGEDARAPAATTPPAPPLTTSCGPTWCCSAPRPASVTSPVVSRCSSTPSARPWSQGQLADKVYAGFTSTQTAHGGQESTLLNLYTRSTTSAA